MKTSGRAHSLQLSFSETNRRRGTMSANCDGLLPMAECVVAKDFDDIAKFTARFIPSSSPPPPVSPKNLTDLLRSSFRCLPSPLRCALTEALIILNKRKFEEIGDTLGLFMELQSLGDKSLRKLAFDHVVHSIRRMNQKKHNDEAKNQTLQNLLFSMLQEEEDDESKAKSSLMVLCDLHRRIVWCDDRTSNAICTACFHSSSRIMIAALLFLLGYDLEQVDDSDALSSEDEMTLLDYDMLEEALESDASSNVDEMIPQKVVLNREAVNKTVHKRTIATSKKKKQAKLHRGIDSMERQQRSTSEKTTPNHYSPLNHLKDAQGFVEKLFFRLEVCNERPEVKMMMLKVIARTIGLHRLILLNFYPFLQKYVQPHQCNITEILAVVVQACHDMVPLAVVKPLFRQVINQFVHDYCCTEAVVVGLNTVRELLLRIPQLMTKRLFQVLVLYKKSHEKAISKGARSVINLFLEDCGCPINLNAQPAFGEVNVSSTVPVLKFLKHEDEDDDDDGRDEDVDGKTKLIKVKSKKRRFVDYTGQLIAEDITLRALKRSTESKIEYELSDFTDGILSNEDFKRIEELKTIIHEELPQLWRQTVSIAPWVRRMEYLSSVCEKTEAHFLSC